MVYLIGVDGVGKTMVLGTAVISVVISGFRTVMSLVTVICFFFFGVGTASMLAILGAVVVTLSAGRDSKTRVLDESTIVGLNTR